MFNNRRSHQKQKYYIVGICAIIFVYLFLFSRYQSFEYQKVIKNVKPEKVWEFVADFSKMKNLNPTIFDFRIISDHGNNDDWKYSVEYSEKLSHWPYWTNIAIGNYHVRKTIRNMKYFYLVESTHKTCFFGFYCVRSIGEFQITDLNDKDTLCIDTVKYQCPPFLGAFCRKEVEYQRKEIMFNLEMQFSKNQY